MAASRGPMTVDDLAHPADKPLNKYRASRLFNDLLGNFLLYDFFFVIW